MEDTIQLTEAEKAVILATREKEKKEKELAEAERARKIAENKQKAVLKFKDSMALLKSKGEQVEKFYAEFQKKYPGTFVITETKRKASEKYTLLYVSYESPDNVYETFEAQYIDKEIFYRPLGTKYNVQVHVENDGYGYKKEAWYMRLPGEFTDWKTRKYRNARKVYTILAEHFAMLEEKKRREKRATDLKDFALEKLKEMYPTANVTAECDSHRNPYSRRAEYTYSYYVRATFERGGNTLAVVDYTYGTDKNGPALFLKKLYLNSSAEKMIDLPKVLNGALAK